MTSSLAFGPALVVMIAATFVLAGMVKGVTGMGLPTVSMGILGSLISPVAAAAMLLLPSLISNLFQFGGGGNTRQLLKRLWPMLLTVVVATLLASAWITGGDTTRTQFALGVALVAYAIWTLAGKKITVAPQREKPYSLVIGFVTGLLTGGTGVFVMPAVPWIQSLGFEMARNRLQVAISLLDRPVLILTNQPTVGGRKRIINGPGGRGGAKGAEKG